MHRREPSLPAGPWGVRRPLAALRRLAFWLAIALPMSYVPLLSVGIDDRTGPVLAVLVALNLACLLVGHEYSP